MYVYVLSERLNSHGHMDILSIWSTSEAAWAEKARLSSEYDDLWVLTYEVKS